MNINSPMNEQECVELLRERGYQVVYKPRVYFPNSRSDYERQYEEMDVFKACDILGIRDKTDSTLSYLSNDNA